MAWSTLAFYASTRPHLIEHGSLPKRVELAVDERHWVRLVDVPGKYVVHVTQRTREGIKNSRVFGPRIGTCARRWWLLPTWRRACAVGDLSVQGGRSHWRKNGCLDRTLRWPRQTTFRLIQRPGLVWNAALARMGASRLLPRTHMAACAAPDCVRRPN